MTKTLLFILIVFMTGCVSKDNKAPRYGKMESVFIDGDRVCFTINNKQVLSNYEFTAVGRKLKILLSGRSTHLSYPESCFMAPLEKGVIYRAIYTLDNEDYYDIFIKDNNGRVIYLWTYTDCPYMSLVPW
ncbi:hypothetical protein [Leclercia sp.]|uniref:hypothetical protein n=1 Tax=Leclercia sp. TaxID=1898428 RepID=UPI00289BE70A|nr:hypothetical protein [Leclercia sp.]